MVIDPVIIESQVIPLSDGVCYIHAKTLHGRTARFFMRYYTIAEFLPNQHGYMLWYRAITAAPAQNRSYENSMVIHGTIVCKHGEMPLIVS